MSTDGDTDARAGPPPGSVVSGTVATGPVVKGSAGNDSAPVGLYGLLAEFPTPDALLQAARAARERYKHVDAYAPYSVEGLADAVGFTRNRVPLVALLGGLAGGAGAYVLQWYTAVIDYPIDAGGRPLHSWPAFIPATFELTVLGAALAIFFGLWLMNGLPRLNHPLFNAPDFDLASRNRFFLCIRASDAAFDLHDTADFLHSLRSLRVSEVAEEAT
jgi:hypothetical protein